MSPDLLRRTEMKSKAGAQCGSAPRDPPENGQAGRDKQQRCCAQRRKFLCSGQDVFVRRAARYDPDFGFPLRGSQGKFAAGRLTVRALTCPRCADCTESSLLLPHAVVVSPPYSGGQGGIPLAALSFRVFLSPEKEKRIGSDDVGKSLL